MKKTPRLENWHITENGYLWGEVYDDIRFADGTFVGTTRIQELTATTKNTTYKLVLKVPTSVPDAPTRPPEDTL